MKFVGKFLCAALCALFTLLAAHDSWASQWVSRSSVSIYGELDYLLYVPTQPKGPLIVALHGCDQDAQTFANITQFNALAEQEGFTVLYPQQSSVRNIEECWNWFLPIDQTRGYGEPYMIAQATETVIQSEHIDPTRVFITGLSAGAAMANVMASCYSDIFAAVAIHSGLEYLAASNPLSGIGSVTEGGDLTPTQSAQAAFQCSGKVGRMLPAFVVQGSKDILTATNEDQVLAQFVFLNDLLDDGKENGSFPHQPTQVVTETPAGLYPYTISAYDFDGAVFVEKIVVEGMEHAWSGGTAGYAMSDPKGPSATLMTWQFFSQFAR